MTNEGAVRWFTEHGQPRYLNSIERIRAEIESLNMFKHIKPRRADAYLNRIAFLEVKIAEIAQEAYDRYDDYKTDMLE